MKNPIKIHPYGYGNFAVFERDGIFSNRSTKVEFTKPEYDALIASETPTVETTALCDYLFAANTKTRKSNTFGAVVDRFRANKYTVQTYELSYNDMYIHGDVISENGRPVVITADTGDNITHTVNVFDSAFNANLKFLTDKKVITI